MNAVFGIDLMLLVLVIGTAVAAVEVRNLYSAVMLASIYSLLMACFWTTMDAVDVAYTEAAVGAGISTILCIGTLVLTGSHETVRKAVHWPALLACVCAGGFLVYGTLDMPPFGARNNPAHTHPVYAGYTQQTVPKTPHGKSWQNIQEYEARKKAEEEAALAAGKEPDHGHGHDNFFHGHVPNQVTSIIVAYRGYDTMFETCVIFTAGVGMILLLRGRKGNPQKGGLL